MKHFCTVLTCAACLLSAYALRPGMNGMELPAADWQAFAALAPDNSPAADQIPSIEPRITRKIDPQAYGDASRIILSSGIEFSTRFLGKNGEPPVQSSLRSPDLGSAGGYCIVQFSGPIYETSKQWLTSLGVAIHFYVPNYSFVCRIPDVKTLEIIRANPSVTWAGLFHPAYKLSTLFDRHPDVQEVTILLFDDADMGIAASAIQSLASGAALNVIDNGINKMIQGQIRRQDIELVAMIPEVYWVEPLLPNYQHNQEYQWVVQAGYLSSAPGGADNTYRRMWANGILGQGEIINHCDSGINCNHYQHRANSPAITTWGLYTAHNKIVAYDSGAPGNIVFGDGSGASYHGTHTGCTTAGNDTVLGSSYRDGIAKMARLYHNDCGDNTSSSIYTFGDLNDLFIRSYNKYYASNGIRAHITTNSWGSDAAGAYTAQCLASDQFMWAHKDFLACFSNGNAGSAGSVGSPASAKSCLSVGGTGNSTSCRSIYSSTSRGPTQDGRRKPTICTPGSGVSSATSGTSTYGSLSGTSMACPGAAGSAALVRQYLREGWYPYGKKVAGNEWSYISAALVKAMLINSADNNMTSYTVPDNNVGWGRIDLDSVAYFAGDTRKLVLMDDTIGVLTGEAVDYHIQLPSGTSQFKVALVWTDYPGNPAVGKQIVNDLDLYVRAPTGVYYRGNQYSGGVSIANPTTRDTLNVEECVRLNSLPSTGDWLVRVEARNVPYGPQPFAVVVSYSGSTVAGFVQLDKPAYRANDFIVDTVRIRVEDPGYGSAGAIDTVLVRIAGKFVETAPETVKCAEIADSAFVFKGSIPILFHKAAHGDGRISAGQGDTIFATYIDASPSFTSTTWALVDAYYFTIADVHAENIDATSAQVRWATNEGANQTVRYGTSPSSLNLSVTVDTPYVLPHRVGLTGLSPKTTYYYDVESRDFRGNVVRDDNGGAHYSFTTKAMAGTDVLVVLLNSNLQGEEFAHPEFMRTALDSGGWTYNWWSTRDNGAFTRNQLKNYKAVYFQVGQENYPAWTPAQRETIKLYHDGGARFAMTGHDAGWDAWENPLRPADTAFCYQYLHFHWRGDITATTWTSLRGISGDPISGSYTGGVTYQPFRSGAAGDSILFGGGAGTNSYVWHGGSAGDSCGIKWESSANMGTSGDGVWGGHRTRVVFNGFEITQIDTANDYSTTRTDILNKMFIWLIGHDHPDCAISSPTGGSTYTTSPISIAWTANAYGGATIDTTWLEYSPDGGSTWLPIVSGTGITSPYSWNITSCTNGSRYRVRVSVCDGGLYPSMKGMAETGSFTINRPGGDLTGPKVVPNSIVMAGNPVFVTASGQTVQFTAVVSDSETGMSPIASAQWFLRSVLTDTAGTVAQDGSWDEVLETVVGTITFNYSPGTTRICTLSVRGCDNASKAPNRGPWYSRTFTVIDGSPIIGIQEAPQGTPLVYELYAAGPNPALRAVRIGFALPHTDRVTVRIYNAMGQAVRTLVDGTRPAGYYTVTWNGKDDQGRAVANGIYFYQMTTDKFSDTRKAVFLR